MQSHMQILEEEQKEREKAFSEEFLRLSHATQSVDRVVLAEESEKVFSEEFLRVSHTVYTVDGQFPNRHPHSRVSTLYRLGIEDDPTYLDWLLVRDEISGITRLLEWRKVFDRRTTAALSQHTRNISLEDVMTVLGDNLWQILSVLLDDQM